VELFVEVLSEKMYYGPGNEDAAMWSLQIAQNHGRETLNLLNALLGIMHATTRYLNGITSQQFRHYGITREGELGLLRDLTNRLQWEIESDPGIREIEMDRSSDPTIHYRFVAGVINSQLGLEQFLLHMKGLRRTCNRFYFFLREAAVETQDPELISLCESMSRIMQQLNSNVDVV
jgi:hypothetical protein